MTEHKSNDPLHGVTLEMILKRLVDFYGWEAMGQKINIRCFNHDPSIKSSLTFLRKNQWARDEVEGMYVLMLIHQDREKEEKTGEG